jgi:hypothetical protein
MHIDSGMGLVPDDQHPLTGRLTDLLIPDECDRVSEKHGLGYSAWHEDARLRIKAGQCQEYCAMCCKFKFAVERCNLFKKQ